MKNISLASIFSLFILFAPQVFAQSGKSAANSAPPVVSFATTAFTIEEGQNFAVEVKAHDVDGRIRRCYINVDDGENYHDRRSPYQWYGPRDSILTAMKAGSYTLNATCRDDNRLETTISQTLLVKPKEQEQTAPIVAFGTSSFAIQEGENFSVTVNASDNDGTINRCYLNVDGGENHHDTTAPYEWYGPRDSILTGMKAGSYAVNATCRDNSNLETSISRTLIVEATKPEDISAPVLTLPGDLTVEANSSNGSVVNFSVSASDDTDPDPMTSCFPASGAVFPLGSTIVNCNATDTSGNRKDGSFRVSVVDTTKPQLTIPASLTMDSGNGESLSVSFTASAFDSVDGSTGVSCTPVSGSLFPVGDTSVACSTADSAGNTASDSFVVSIVDTSPEPEVPSAPVVAFSTQSFTIEEGENFAVEVTASDADGFIKRCFISVNQGENYNDTTAPYQWYGPRDPILTALPAGNHTISASCRDNDGKQTTISRNLLVQNSAIDQEAPVITVPADFSVPSESPEGQIVTFSVSAVDAVDGDTAVFCLPESGDHFAVGETTVICSATDNSGNTGEKSFLVSVTDNSETGGERTAYLQWNIPTSRTDGSALNTSELGSYSIVYSTSATLNSATILDVSASNSSGELASGHTITFPSAGSYYLGMAVSDTNGNMSELSDIVEINIP